LILPHYFIDIDISLAIFAIIDFIISLILFSLFAIAPIYFISMPPHAIFIDIALILIASRHFRQHFRMPLMPDIDAAAFFSADCHFILLSFDATLSVYFFGFAADISPSFSRCLYSPSHISSPPPPPFFDADIDVCHFR
jgi:hypothetical protein